MEERGAAPAGAGAAAAAATAATVAAVVAAAAAATATGAGAGAGAGAAAAATDSDLNASIAASQNPDPLAMGGSLYTDVNFLCSSSILAASRPGPCALYHPSASAFRLVGPRPRPPPTRGCRAACSTPYAPLNRCLLHRAARPPLVRRRRAASRGRRVAPSDRPLGTGNQNAGSSGCSARLAPPARKPPAARPLRACGTAPCAAPSPTRAGAAAARGSLGRRRARRGQAAPSSGRAGSRRDEHYLRPAPARAHRSGLAAKALASEGWLLLRLEGCCCCCCCPYCCYCCCCCCCCEGAAKAAADCCKSKEGK